MRGYLAPLLHFCPNLSWDKVQNYQENSKQRQQNTKPNLLASLSLSLCSLTSFYLF